MLKQTSDQTMLINYIWANEEMCVNFAIQSSFKSIVTVCTL